MNRWLAGASSSAFVLAACLTASAQPSASVTPITVEAVVPVCEPGPFDRGAFIESLRVELAALGVSQMQVHATAADAAASPTTESTLATVIVAPADCSANADSVVLEVVDHASKKSVERRMTLGDVAADARPRALALAVVELLGASWAELFMPRPASPEQRELPAPVQQSLALRLRSAVAPVESARESEPAPPGEPAPPAEPASRSARIGARLAFWSMPSRGTSLVGGGLGASLDVGDARLHLALDAGFGDTRVRQGEIQVGFAGAAAGADLVARSSVELSLGPRLRAGYGWATGDPAQSAVTGSSQSGAIVALLAGAAVRVPVSPRLFAALSTEFGHFVSGLNFLADGERAAGLDGALFGLGLGLDIEL